MLQRRELIIGDINDDPWDLEEYEWNYYQDDTLQSDTSDTITYALSTYDFVNETSIIYSNESGQESELDWELLDLNKMSLSPHSGPTGVYTISSVNTSTLVLIRREYYSGTPPVDTVRVEHIFRLSR